MVNKNKFKTPPQNFKIILFLFFEICPWLRTIFFLANDLSLSLFYFSIFKTCHTTSRFAQNDLSFGQAGEDDCPKKNDWAFLDETACRPGLSSSPNSCASRPSSTWSDQPESRHSSHVFQHSQVGFASLSKFKRSMASKWAKKAKMEVFPKNHPKNVF